MSSIQIQQGDTLGQIANRRGTTVDAIQRANPQITNPNLIQAGASLNIPEGPTPQNPTGAIPSIISTDNIRRRVRSAQADIEDVRGRRRRVRQPQTLESTLFDVEDIQKEQNNLFDDFQDQLKDVQRGNIPFTEDEQAQLDSISSAFANASKQQAILNAQRTGASSRLAGRSGRSRFAPELAEQEISATIQTGIDKIKDLDIQAAGALGQAKDAIKQKNFKNILESNDRLNSLLKDRKQTIGDIQGSILNIAKEGRAKAQELRNEREFELNVKEKGLNIAIKGLQLQQERDSIKRQKELVESGQLNLTKEQKSDAFKLQDDWEKESADFKKQAAARSRVVASAKDPSAAGDIALIFNFMKTLDPGSTVREGEFATAANAGGVSDIIKARYNKVLKGERLSENQRNDFVDRTERIFQSAVETQKTVDDQFSKRASQFGVPAEAIIRDIVGASAIDIADTVSNASDDLDTEIESGGTGGLFDTPDSVSASIDNLLNFNIPTS